MIDSSVPVLFAGRAGTLDAGRRSRQQETFQSQVHHERVHQKQEVPSGAKTGTGIPGILTLALALDKTTKTPQSKSLFHFCTSFQ